MRISLAVCVAAVLLFACAPVAVEHQGRIPAPDQPAGATYSWLEHAVPGNDIRVNNPAIAGMVRDSVDRRLQAKGYRKAASGEADYLVTWFGTIEEEVKEISLASFYSRSGYAALLGPLPDKDDVEDGKVRKVFARGTLILDVLDRRDGKVLWRGSATNTLGEAMSEVGKARYIDTSVAKILEELPAR